MHAASQEERKKLIEKHFDQLKSKFKIEQFKQSTVVMFCMMVHTQCYL